MNGFVYFLTNKSMPGLVKVGHTTGSIEDRIAKLNGTGVPTPFALSALFLVKNAETVEKQIHKALKDYRLNNQREFFAASISKILNKCLLLVEKSLIDNGESVVLQSNSLKSELTELQTNLLLALVNDRYRGKSLYDFQQVKYLNLNSLLLESELESLKTNALVEFKRGRTERATGLWRITSKGIKLLFDIGSLNANEPL